MHVRIARFEGIEVGRIDAMTEEMRQSIEAGRRGEAPPDDLAEVFETLRQTVSRVVQPVDRGSGTALGLTFFETEEDMRRGDAALEQLSPGEGGGRRTSVERFEVALDEQMS